MNARKEFLEAIGSAKVKCAFIKSLPKRDKKAILKLSYSEKDFDIFLKILDFDYDNELQSDEFEGVIWLEDGTWIRRFSDSRGYGWWEHLTCPDIPEFLKIK